MKETSEFQRIHAASELLKSLANRHRLMIVCTLIEGERSVADLETALGIRQPTLSQQLASLREAGIVAARRQAKSVFYKIADPDAVLLVEALHRIFCEAPLPSIKPPRRALAPARTHAPGEAAVFAQVES